MSSSLQPVHLRIYPMEPEMLTRANAVVETLKSYPPAQIETWHSLHGGLYSRTIRICAGVAIAGALVKVPTLLVVDGDVSFNAGGEGQEPQRLQGRHVLAASSGRKQLFVAHADSFLTMIFATQAKTIDQAEAEFTDEAAQLLSRQPCAVNHYQITGE